MKNKKKVIFNGILFALVFCLTIYGVFHGEDLQKMQEAISRCNLGWLIPGVVCVIVFIWGESIIIWYMMRTYGIKLKKRICFLFSSVGFFFSCITPSATGGQPMQIYFMKKEKIPIPVATVILMIVTITYKLVLVVIGCGIFIFARDFVIRYFGGMIYIFYLGLVLNVFCVALMLLLVFHPTLTRAMMLKGLKLLERLHLLKSKAGRLQKLEKSMDLYNDTASYLRSHIGVIINVFFITFLQRVVLFAVTVFVYLAFGLSQDSFLEIVVLQAAISISVDMLPLPGGMGISEKLFLTIFAPFFGSFLLSGMVLSRGIAYYSQLLLSAALTLLTVVVYDRKERLLAKNNEE